MVFRRTYTGCVHYKKKCIYCTLSTWAVASGGPQLCAVVEDVLLQQLSAPSAPFCSDLFSAVHTWSTMTALHTGIFHFLFSVTLRGSPPPRNSPQTNGKTSVVLKLGGRLQRHPHQPVTQQHGWYFRPSSMTQLLWRERGVTDPLLLTKAPNVVADERQWKF